MAGGRGVRAAVRRPPAPDRRGRRWGPAGVHRLDRRPGPPECGRGEKNADGSGGQADQALGRSRGGFGTKVHLAAADDRTAVGVVLTPGQAGDAPAFDPLWEQARPRVGVVDEVVADTAYDSDAIRNRLLDEGVMPQIPSNPRRTDPWPLYEPSYRERNAVERLVGRLKQYRRVATRYD
ncbi:MAG: transposase, partial [Gemmataceae bacterium]|nr:transposase [Gemmataceae bacterium]